MDINWDQIAQQRIVAGPEMDTLVYLSLRQKYRVNGLRDPETIKKKHYSRNWEDAFYLVQCCRDLSPSFSLVKTNDDEWEASLGGFEPGKANTGPLAICVAVLCACIPTKFGDS